jgi:hypothetical protein
MMAISDAARLVALRRLSASGIKPGWISQDLISRNPISLKPTLPMLKAEVFRRAQHYESVPRYENWSGPTLVGWLASHVPDVDDELCDKLEMEGLARSAELPEERPSDLASRWKKTSHLPLLVNCLMYLKSDFLDRDRR